MSLSLTMSLGVVPVLVGPLQALLAALPYILLAILTALVSLFKPSVLKSVGQLLWAQKLAVVAVVAVVVALVMGGSALLAGRSGEIAAIEAGTAWPLYRGSPDRRGYAGGPDPTTGNVIWSFKDDRRKIDSFYCSPAVVGNRVYATGALSEYFTDRGAVYCLDADSGRLVWTYADQGYRATFSSPAAAEGCVVVGEGLHLTSDARVVCLDAAASERDPGRRGVKLWEYRTASHVESSPCIADGRAYVGAGDDGLYCFALAGDGQGGPRVLWHLEGSDYPDCETSPVVYDGRVYFSLGMGGQAICCVDAETGEAIWRIPTPAPAFGSPSIADGRLYVGMGYGDYVNNAAQAAENLRKKLTDQGIADDEIRRRTEAFVEAGQLWCVDLQSGEVLWRYDKIGATVLAAPAVADGRVYIGSRDGFVYCLSGDDGELIRRFDAHQPIVSAPAVATDHVYAVTSAGTLYGLDRRTLSRALRVRLNADTMSSPAVARGHLYLGSTGAGLLCIGEPGGGEKADSAWPGEGGPDGTGCLDDSVIAEKGKYAWRVNPVSDSVETPTLLSPLACLNRSLYVGAVAGRRQGLARIALAAEMGDKPTVAWFAPTGNPIGGSAAVTADAVYCVDGTVGDAGRLLRCLDPVDGALRWTRRVAPAADGALRLAGRLLFVADEADGVSCLDVSDPAAVETLWTARVGATVGAALAVDDIVLQAVGDPASLVALDRRTGLELWRQALAEPPRSGVAWAANRAWVASAGGLMGFSPVLDEPPVVIDSGPVVGPLVTNTRYLLAGSPDGGLRAVDLERREIVAIDDALAGLPPVLTASDEAIYFVDGAVQVLDLNSGAVRHWATLRSFLGRPATAMISTESLFFYGSDTKGLICLEPRE